MSLDLTNRRYSLLERAKSIIKDNHSVKFVFADINCYLVLKLNDDKFLTSIAKMNLRFYKNVSLCSVTTRFILDIQ